MYNLQKQSEELIYELNWVRGFRKGFEVPAKESVKGFIKVYGDVIDEIDLCLRELCNAPLYEETFTADQAAQQLHVSPRGLFNLIQSGKLEARKVAGGDYIIGSRAIAKYLGFQKKETIHQQNGLKTMLLDRINSHRDEMDLQFTAGGWVPSAWTMWAKAASLYLDIQKYGADRLKLCDDCSSFYWDQSINKSGKYCHEKFCRDERNRRNVAAVRNTRDRSKQKVKRRK